MSEEDFLRKFADGSYSLGETLYESERKYKIIQCNWCLKPVKKRTDSFSQTDNSFCSRWCESRHKTSSDITKLENKYDDSFWFYIREKVWDRDDQTCQHCGKPRGVLERRPDVVVIDEEIEDMFSEDNLVSLCNPCKVKIDMPQSRRAAKESDVTFDTDLYHCPHGECSKEDPESWFETERSMNIHYGLSHEGSLAKEDIECIDCSTIFSTYGKQKRCRICKLKESDYNIETCHNCNEEYLSIGSHWSQDSECTYPELSDRQMDILTGMVMGDATVQKHSTDTTYCRLQWKMITEEFLEWLDDELGLLNLGEYTIQRTPEEAAQSAIKSGLTDQAFAEDYNTIYSNMTRSHPDFEWFGRWYDMEGTKKFPLEEIDLSPMVLKVWYVCDGTLNKSNPQPRSRISAVNESDSIEELSQFIEIETGIETTATEHGNILFNTKETEEFFEYIGDPLPGFEYKWPEEYK